MNLSDEQRQLVYEALLEISVNGKLKRNSTAIVASMFGVNRRVVQRIWTNVKKCIAAGTQVDIKSKKSRQLWTQTGSRRCGAG
jgi:hypothetical protein